MEFWMIGKTAASYLQEGVADYEKRLRRYLPFGLHVLPDVKAKKNNGPAQRMAQEARAVLQQLRERDTLILLDEQGKSFSSEQFAAFVDRLQLSGGRRIIFLVAGAYGAHDALRERADHRLSLSSMTFSHQMIRLFFLEQLYRAMTILRNEPYHNA